MKTPSLIPFALLPLCNPALALDPVYVTDNAGTTLEAVWKLEDLNGDGDFDDAGEVWKFYDDTVAGAIDLATNTGIKVGADGSVYVSDSNIDMIIRLRDLNADGDANDAGEWTLYFDGNPGGNASGVVMTSASNFCIDGQGVFWVATAGTGGGGNDAILRLQDLNLDGDTNDANEAREYYTIHLGALNGDWLPQATAIGADGKVYYTENGNDPLLVKGIYRLDDLDASGFIDQAAEVTAYFLPPPGPTNNNFHWNLRQDADGWLYIGDTGFEQIWRCKDLNADDDAMDPGENVLWWTGAAASLIWDFDFQLDGSLIACESQAPDRLLRMKDANCDGLIQSGEVETVYDETLTLAIGDVRGIALVGPQGLGKTPFCFGDGTQAVPCPCSNSGVCGRGCDNSQATGGALLAVIGSIAPDTLLLTSSFELPNATSIFLQGSSELAAPAVFGDGLRCVGGTLKRLYIHAASGGVVSAPVGADPSVSARSAILGDPIAPGSTRGYQVYYRDPNPAFCASPVGSTWNVSNGVRVRW